MKRDRRLHAVRKRSIPAEEAPVASSSTRGPHRYEIVCDVLQRSIQTGRIPEGLVLTEGPIADLLGVSRAPVRQALAILHDHALVRRFQGRGYLVGRTGAQVRRTRLRSEMLDMEHGAAALQQARPAAERIFGEVQEAVTRCIAFGHFRVQEAILAELYDVSRTVVREALMRLQERGLVEKDATSRWIVGPLTARAVANDYEIRRHLEPAALLSSGPSLSKSAVDAARQRLEDILQGREEFTPEKCWAIEQDLHVTCLLGSSNEQMLRIIRSCQLPIFVNQMFFGALGVETAEPILMEHKLVFEHLCRGAYAAAAAGLAAHLAAAAPRTLQRLKVLSVLPDPALPPYLIRIT